MRDLSTVPHFHAIEDIVDVLTNKIQTKDRGFFRVEVAYFLAKMAATMRAVIDTPDRGEIPVNVYAVALGPSGFGKGHSVNIVENQMLSGFRKRFMEDTFPLISEAHLDRLALERAAKKGTTEEDEKLRLEKEFTSAGALAFTFDSGTSAAVKQMRQKLLLADCGSINMQIDEIGSNLINATEVLNVFLELYDQGMVKQKLTKNTADNTRGEELDGKTPTNALLFGTPSKLLDGGQTEDAFYSFLETGYARRCLFGWGIKKRASEKPDAEAIFDKLIAPQNTTVMSGWANHFTLLADATKFQWTMEVPRDVAIENIRYKIECESRADMMAEHEEIRKAEMEHRYFKALKLAGAFAFVDESSEITMDHLYSAIKLVEESGEAFERLMTREKPYVKLARYIAACDSEVTHADLHEALPFYKSGQGARKEMMDLAMSWGYKQHIVIKKSFLDTGIELFSGETLKETNLNQLILSHSDDYAYNYQSERAPFEELHKLIQMEPYRWANHHFRNGHRSENNTETGFNLLVLDVDGTIPMHTAHDLLKEYKFLTYTTKRHTEQENRFRILMPINYELHLDSSDFKEFMENVYAWMPFEVDDTTGQRSRKWECYNSSFHYNKEGEVLDALRFIPKTSKNEIYKQTNQKLESFSNLERWFAQQISTGNRNNQMIKFALALVDSGMPYPEVETKVLEFNKKISNSLSEDEIRSTILKTVAKKIHTI